MEQMLNSREIMSELKKYVVGQDEYVRQLSIFGYKHQLNQKLIEEGKKPVNNNLLVAGPTGTGKTFGAKKLAEIIDIPFMEFDCSNIVQTGYKGLTSVEHILIDARSNLGSGVRRCIIYLDEFDKVYDPGLDHRGDGPAQQQNFLKLLEPNRVTIARSRNDGPASMMDTSGISFIATGSFDYVRRNKRTTQQNRMGFAGVDHNDSDRLSKSDIINAGFLPELIGRFGTLININELTEKDYYDILLKSKDSSYTQYKDFFEATGVRLDVGKKVLEHLAKNAREINTGARGLTEALNEPLDDCVFEISSDDTISAIHLRMKDDQIVAEYEHGGRMNASSERDKTEGHYFEIPDEID